MPAVYIIETRNDTAINWATINPILNEGEMGWERDTNRLKIGDGFLQWNDLPYFEGSGGSDLFINYAVNDIDEVSTITYICMCRPNSDTWLIKRVEEASGDYEITYANISNNPLVETYSAAFLSRASLTYNNIGSIII